MRVRIAHKIMSGLFTLLILNASLATNAPLSATSCTLRSEKQQSGSARNVDDRPSSPRLLALQDQLKSGDRDALNNFWKEITERGAPMIEGVPGSDSDVLVTILWRAREETRNVLDLKSTRLNSSHVRISYAVFCLKKQK